MPALPIYRARHLRMPLQSLGFGYDPPRIRQQYFSPGQRAISINSIITFESHTDDNPPNFSAKHQGKKALFPTSLEPHLEDSG